MSDIRDDKNKNKPTPVNMNHVLFKNGSKIEIMQSETFIRGKGFYFGLDLANIEDDE